MTKEGLTARQAQILKALIDEYLETAAPVGSIALEKKYNLGISPATIRNEMMALARMGYLRQPHTSAGRIPTPLAMKFYIGQLMEERQISLTEEVKAKENVWDSRHNLNELFDSATRSLAQRTNSFAISATSDGLYWSHGHANIFNTPNFFDFRVCQSLFSVLDEYKRLEELFFNHLTGISPIEVLFGEELGWDFFEPIGIVATRFAVGNKEGAIGVIGPYGLNYPSIIPTVRHMGELIQELANK